MIFGRVPAADAAGAVLAHTLRVGEQVFKKGRALSEDDAAALAAGGHASVICARLEAGDVGEDEAARRIARLVAGPGVRVADAATGRCNLFAERPGLLVVDGGGVDALNALDEAITLATLTSLAPVEAEEMVGTVKIIPFAVDGRVVARVPSRALLTVRPWVPHRAGLILTRFPSTSEALLDRAAASQRERLRRLGSELVRDVRVAHEESAVAGALETMLGEGLAPILVLGASAIVDRRDVIPGAVARIGGEIDRLGMPVDPGNLLLLAHRGATPILGVPGCARSLKRSGFDWVLERLCAGISVVSLAALGVGGLLVEMPSRPHPRLGGEPTDD